MQQLYAHGFTMPQIATRLQISHQAVSKMLNLKDNPRLRRRHVARRALDHKLIAGEEVTVDDFSVDHLDTPPDTGPGGKRIR